MVGGGLTEGRESRPRIGIRGRSRSRWPREVRAGRPSRPGRRPFLRSPADHRQCHLEPGPIRRRRERGREVVAENLAEDGGTAFPLGEQQDEHRPVPGRVEHRVRDPDPEIGPGEDLDPVCLADLVGDRLALVNAITISVVPKVVYQPARPTIRSGISDASATATTSTDWFRSVTCRIAWIEPAPSIRRSMPGGPPRTRPRTRRAGPRASPRP